MDFNIFSFLKRSGTLRPGQKLVLEKEKYPMPLPWANPIPIDSPELEPFFDTQISRETKADGKTMRQRIPYKDDDGLAERIPAAVRPLTEGGDFELEWVGYDIYYSAFRIRLSSDTLDIDLFRQLTAVTEQKYRFIPNNCILYFKPARRRFRSGYLLPVIGADMPVTRRWISLSRKSREGADPGYMIERIGILLEDSWYMEELFTFCRGLKRNLPRIRAAFAPDQLDETIRLYTLAIVETDRNARTF
jgi:hypothetical protein